MKLEGIPVRDMGTGFRDESLVQRQPFRLRFSGLR